MTTSPKRLRLIESVVGGVLFIVLAASFFEWPEKRLPSEPFSNSELARFRDRSRLRPHLQHILAEVEDGNMLGSQADIYRGDLEKADEVRASDRLTTYVFYKNPELRASEGNPALHLVVQNEFGQVFRCAVSVPEY
jgi:hypothetical protein